MIPFTANSTNCWLSLTPRPPYGEGRARTPTAEAKLPEGDPAGRGIPVDEGLPGTQTFVKPLDDNGTGESEGKDEPIWRVRNPRDLVKERSRVDVNDQSQSGPSYYGLGKPHQSPKTKYPYRDGKPNTHNAAFVAGLWAVERAPERLLQASRRTVVAAPLATLRDGLNPKTVERAQKCAATLKRADIKNLRWIFSVDCGNGPKVVKFKADRLGNVTQFQKMDFHVACSCPAWRWQGPEFHSTTKDFQDPNVALQGTASPPDIRDPERINMVCKHVASVLNLTRDWTVPLPKRKKKAESAQARRIYDLFKEVSKHLNAAFRLRWSREPRDPNQVAQDLGRAATKLRDELFFEFEDEERGKRLRKKLRKVTNLKKMLDEWIDSPSWPQLKHTLSNQSTKTKNARDKFVEYWSFVEQVVRALDIETEDVFRFDNYTVTMFTSPRGVWDQSKVEALKEVLQRTNRTLSSRGLGKVTGGRVMAYPGKALPGGALATYNIKDDVIRLAANDDVAAVHKSLVHELGHRAYFRTIGSQGRAAWEQFFGDNVKPLNVDSLLNNWERHWREPKDWEAEKFGKYLGYYLHEVADPEEKMWLHLIADKIGIEEDFHKWTGSPTKKTVPGFIQLMQNRDKVKVFLHPVTAYSGKDAHELFAETFAYYAIQGPGRIPEIVRHAFQQALPQFKTGHTKSDED